MNLFLHDLNFEFRCSQCDYKTSDGMLGGESIGKMVDCLILYLVSPCPKCDATPEDKKLLALFEREQERLQRS